MTTHSFYQMDVFTDIPLTGNPLAVFPDANGLDTRTMQALAREMNLSETTFLGQSTVAKRRVRFFTPTAEIPLAGHPTIGTWWLLAELRVLDIPPDGTTRVTQETGAGVLPVDIQMKSGRPIRVTMIQPRPQFGARCTELEKLSAMLGCGQYGIASTPDPQIVATALPQLMVPMASLAHLRSLPSGGAGGDLARFLESVGTNCVMCYTTETERPDATAQCRMFAPGFGVPEDPATGSAAGALGCYLVHHGVIPTVNGAAEITIDQGREIGRASRISVRITASSNGSDITEVAVGGTAVRVIHGTVTL
jgi:trans-2,3-dihydro-3-hydroxyanthranilate isomerase